jgi:pimeloyl-ACP methyl ester carboxylesterase
MATASVNGITVSYTDSGGDGPVVVLSHGYLMDSSMFEPQVAAAVGVGDGDAVHGCSRHGAQRTARGRYRKGADQGAAACGTGWAAAGATSLIEPRSRSA